MHRFILEVSQEGKRYLRFVDSESDSSHTLPTSRLLHPPWFIWVPSLLIAPRALRLSGRNVPDSVVGCMGAHIRLSISIGE